MIKYPYGYGDEMQYICDECGEEIYGTPYRRPEINEHLCEGCAAEYADQVFEEYTLSDRLDIFNCDLEDFSCREGAETELSRMWYELEDYEKCKKLIDFDDIKR